MELIGRITQTATVRKLKGDRNVVNFTIALNDYYKLKGSEKGKQVTTYVNCSYWINPAIAPRLTKGSLVELSGRIYVTAYTASDGEARASLNCHVNNIKVHQTGKTIDSVKTDEPRRNLPFQYQEARKATNLNC